MAYTCWSCPPWSVPIQGLSSATSFAFQPNPSIQFLNFTLKLPHQPTMLVKNRPPLITACSSSSSSSSSSSAESVETAATAAGNPPTVLRKRTRYRKQYPGEREGITEEMRFVAMRLRNVNGKKIESHEKQQGGEDDEGADGGSAHTWQPAMEGLLKYLVDSKLVFNAVERIVDESNDVSYAYFRKTGLERSKGLSEDLEWFSQQDNVIPPPSSPGITYVKYLEELAEKSAPLFLCHFYNIYFSHIAGGQVIAKRVSENLLEGRELQFYRWEGDAEGLLKGVREKLNMLGEHWSRDEKNKCLREATKSFRYLGQIVRLIIL